MSNPSLTSCGDAEAFQKETGCSDIVRERLVLYANLLREWQPRINLVGPKTLPVLWTRHMLDSAQLYPLLPNQVTRLVDLGSGAGFPGAVLSIMGAQGVALIESDQRKAVFLREVARETGANFKVISDRIESSPPFPADVITARALAPVEKLLDYALPFLTENTVCLFLKGKNVQEELTDSRKKWNMAIERIPSVTDSSGVVLKLEGISRHHGLDHAERKR